MTKTKERPKLPLSDDAKVILGGWFGIGLTEVSFALKEGRPTKRCQAAIDECVRAEMLWREPHRGTGFRLKPLVPCEEYRRWITKNRDKCAWPLMEDITDGAAPTAGKVRAQ